MTDFTVTLPHDRWVKVLDLLNAPLINQIQGQLQSQMRQQQHRVAVQGTNGADQPYTPKEATEG
jgi:hypothetical protein